MPTPVVEEFARILVERVRDASIQNCDTIFHSPGSARIIQRWRAARARSAEELANVLIPDIVDETIANLLIAIDQELLRLSFSASDGSSVDLTDVAKSSGELSGWYGGPEGWRTKYTSQRDRKSTRLNSSHIPLSRMPSSA